MAPAGARPPENVAVPAAPMTRLVKLPMLTLSASLPHNAKTPAEPAAILFEPIQPPIVP